MSHPGIGAGAGQVAALPLQAPGVWQVAAGAQTVPAATKPSDGQAAVVPLQTSATSHGPALGRHCRPAGTLASAGQAAFDPSHPSARSQGPALSRPPTPAPPLISPSP